MKKLLLVLLLVVSASMFAQDFKVQLSLVNPIQVYPETQAIKGARLNIYGKNQALTGFDLGVVNHLGKGSSKGLQFAFAGNMVEGDFEGFQISQIFNVNRSHTLGAQLAPINYSISMKGLQCGVVNISESYEGVQIGLFNYTQSLKGLQIGLINVVKTGGVLPIMPVVNWNF